MVLKTFNLNEEVYKEFSEHCKKQGISMSKKIENFIREELEQIRSGGRISIKRFNKILEKHEIDVQEHSFKKYCQ